MQLHNLKRIHKNKKRGIVGRGGKRGKTSGRGTKGQKARAGRKIRPEMRDMIKRLPKLRGRGKHIFKSRSLSPQIVNLAQIEENFTNGDTINPSALLTKKLINKLGPKSPVKILGSDAFTKKISVSGCVVSNKARTFIEKAGGKIL